MKWKSLKLKFNRFVNNKPQIKGDRINKIAENIVFSLTDSDETEITDIPLIVKKVISISKEHTEKLKETKEKKIEQSNSELETLNTTLITLENLNQ